MIEAHELRAFAAVAKHLSFAKAASDLGHSAPHISKIIAQMEARLQRKLFLRSTRAVKLSPDGERLLPSALRAVDSIHEASDVFQRGQDRELAGKIKITAPQTVAQRILSPKLAAFHALHPKVEFEYVLSDVYLDLVEEGIDVAFRVMRLHDSPLKAVKIAENPVIFCASPKYLKVHKKPLNPDDLKSHSVLSIHHHWDLRFQKSGKKLSHYIQRPWIYSTNGDILVDQARLGMGVLVRSRWGAQRELDLGELVELKLNDQLVSETAIYVVFQENRFMPARVRALIDFFKTRH